MPLTTPETILRTDFNSLSSDGLVKASRRLAILIWGPVARGTKVALEDAEGNGCTGIVMTEDRVMRVRPLWATWYAGPSVRWRPSPLLSANVEATAKGVTAIPA